MKGWGSWRTLVALGGIAFLGLVGGCAAPAAAQAGADSIRVIRGTVTLPGGGPAVGTPVSAGDSKGTITTALTDREGRFVLRVRWAGLLWIRAQTVGWEAEMALSSDAESDGIILPLYPVPVEIVGIEAIVDGQCDARLEDPGRSLFSTLLAAVGLVRDFRDESDSARVVILRYQDDGAYPNPDPSLLDGLTLGPRAEGFEFAIDTVDGALPELLPLVGEPGTSGYMTETRLAGLAESLLSPTLPNPRLILSEQFIGGHCWGPRVVSQEVGVGLAFVPKSSMENYYHLSGVLWFPDAGRGAWTLEARHSGLPVPEGTLQAVMPAQQYPPLFVPLRNDVRFRQVVQFSIGDSVLRLEKVQLSIPTPTNTTLDFISDRLRSARERGVQIRPRPSDYWRETHWLMETFMRYEYEIMR